MNSSHSCSRPAGEYNAESGTDSLRRRHPEQGFTLLELLAALFILGVALTVTLPALTVGSATELKAAARVVAAGLRQTRSRATTTHREAVMEFDVQRRRIALGARSRQLPQRTHLALFTARRERIDATRGTIRFFPDGSSTGGRVTLAMGDRNVLVDVDWLTGRVSILEGKAGEWEELTAFERVRIE